MDAKIAAASGANAIVVSYDGGRQLDGAISSIGASLPIVDAVGDRIKEWTDSGSGIRSGQDMLKTLALGARGTMVGRAFNFGLGALGEAGVTTALEIIQNERDTTMALFGVRNVAGISCDAVLNPY